MSINPETRKPALVGRTVQHEPLNHAEVRQRNPLIGDTRQQTLSNLLYAVEFASAHQFDTDKKVLSDMFTLVASAVLFECTRDWEAVLRERTVEEKVNPLCRPGNTRLFLRHIIALMEAIYRGDTIKWLCAPLVGALRGEVGVMS